jgi:hypothetical protein
MIWARLLYLHIVLLFLVAKGACVISRGLSEKTMKGMLLCFVGYKLQVIICRN